MERSKRTFFEFTRLIEHLADPNRANNKKNKDIFQAMEDKVINATEAFWLMEIYTNE